MALILLATFLVPPFVLAAMAAGISAMVLRGELPWLSVMRGAGAGAMTLVGEVAGAIAGALYERVVGAEPQVVIIGLALGGFLGALIGGFTTRWTIKIAYRMTRWAALRSGVGVASNFDVFR